MTPSCEIMYTNRVYIISRKKAIFFLLLAELRWQGLNLYKLETYNERFEKQNRAL